MPRVRKGSARARKHKRILKAVRGQIGAASRRYHVAIEAWLRAGRYATEGRKLRKRDFRQLWITRISAACRSRGLTYSRFMHALGERGVTLNRKMLADVAVADPRAFDQLAALASGRPLPEVSRAEQAPAAEVREPQPAPQAGAEAPQPSSPEQAGAEAAEPREAPPPEPAAAEPAETKAEARKAKKKAAPAKKKTAGKATATRKKSAAGEARKKATTKKPKSEKGSKE